MMACTGPDGFELGERLARLRSMAQPALTTVTVTSSSQADVLRPEGPMPLQYKLWL